jgi:hypothetical protein
MNDRLKQQAAAQQQAARSLRLQQEKRAREIKQAVANIENKRGSMYG